MARVPDEVDAALAAALALRDAMLDWSRERERAGVPALRVGVGAHVGTVFAGAVGDEERAEFTVLGDAVNVAHLPRSLARPEGLSRDRLRSTRMGAMRDRGKPNRADPGYARRRRRTGHVRQRTSGTGSLLKGSLTGRRHCPGRRKAHATQDRVER